MSETNSCRPYLLRFCATGTGCDLGFGGDPIKREAVTVDQNPHCFPVFLGDVSKLVWFTDGSFDWAYSSHVLEDFVDTTEVLKEWFRILKPGGLLILFLPDQQRYLAHCERHGAMPNQSHKHPDFSFEFLMKSMLTIPHKLIHMEDPVTYNPYSFSVVLAKP